MMFITVRFAVFAAAVFALVGCKKPPAPMTRPPVPVIAAEVLVRHQPVYVERIGQTLGSRDVEIRARVEGFLDTVHFQEGMPVASNALLYTIDDRPFLASQAQARGLLAQAQAAWDKSRRDTNRLGPLWRNNAISRQQYDDALAAEQNAAAAVQSAQAALDTTTIQLGYTRIHSPIEGLVGKTEVKAGNLVGRGASTLLTTVSEVDPISVRFSVSEQNYLDWVRRRGYHDSDYKAADGMFELILADGKLHVHRGHVTFADRQVDAQTGTLLLEVSFPNPEKLIRPGQFARVRFPIEVVTNAVLVPQRAVTELQATYSVFVAGADSKAGFRKVELGPRIENFYLVRSGLKPGDKVIIEGVQKLQNTTPIVVTLTNLSLEVPASNPSLDR